MDDEKRAFEVDFGPETGIVEYNAEDLLRTGGEPDRNDLTLAGRALQKHGARPGGAFSSPGGARWDINERGEQVLRDILTSHDAVVARVGRRSFGECFDVHTGFGRGRGARFDRGGRFRGFLEPPG